MEFAARILFALGWFCVLCIFLGFIRPQILLWWEDTQHRMKILKVYGVGALLSFLLYYLVEIFILSIV